MSSFLHSLASPPAQTLHVLQPTPTTITYTVSTRSVSKTLPAHVGYYAGILVALGSEGEGQLVKLVETFQWRYLIPSALLTLFLVFRRNYTEESLTVLRGLGIQTSTTSSTYLQTPTTRFIPTTNIQDIFIHEAFKGFEVRFYLMIVVEGEDEVVVVFPTLLPRRGVLEVVWRGVRGGLWEQGWSKPKAEVTESNEKVEI
ncbi:GPI-GlcNAc transferase complex, PIG-H component-domain-containing protein [Bipolaris maydis]|nr:GPI-GlcNAc transferase complex, PIG-H component-domain-containing protein [Bipolaris maydis]KAJ6200155.1 GPI-GlcNAc transferase complex, PIG-H component-domain-containing protein [Bipolaris maydis]